MRKNFIYIIAFFIVGIACFYTYKIVNKNQRQNVPQKIYCKKIKSRKVKSQKIGKTKGSLFKPKKEEKLYTIFRKNNDTVKRKMMFFIFVKDAKTNPGIIIINKKNRNTGAIIHDRTDVNELIKEKKPFRNDGIADFYHHRREDSIIEKSFK